MNLKKKANEPTHMIILNVMPKCQVQKFAGDIDLMLVKSNIYWCQKRPDEVDEVADKKSKHNENGQQQKKS